MIIACGIWLMRQKWLDYDRTPLHGRIHVRSHKISKITMSLNYSYGWPWSVRLETYRKSRQGDCTTKKGENENMEVLPWWRRIKTYRTLHRSNHAWCEGGAEDIDYLPWWPHIKTSRTLHRRHHTRGEGEAEHIDSPTWKTPFMSYSMSQRGNGIRQKGKNKWERKKMRQTLGRIGDIDESQDWTISLLTNIRPHFDY